MSSWSSSGSDLKDTGSTGGQGFFGAFSSRGDTELSTSFPSISSNNNSEETGTNTNSDALGSFRGNEFVYGSIPETPPPAALR